MQAHFPDHRRSTTETADLAAGGAGAPPRQNAIIRHRGLTRPNDGLIASLLFVPFFYACCFPVLRGMGAFALIVALAVLSLVGIVFGQRYFRPSSLAFAGTAVVYVALSYVGVLDQGLTLFYETLSLIHI